MSCTLQLHTPHSTPPSPQFTTVAKSLEGTAAWMKCILENLHLSGYQWRNNGISVREGNNPAEIYFYPLTYQMKLLGIS